MTCKSMLFYLGFIVFIKSTICFDAHDFYAHNYDYEILKNFMKERNEIGDLPGENSFTYDDIVAASTADSTADNSIWQIYNIYLFTRDFRDGNTFELLNPMNVSSIKYCHFQTRPTYFIIHGFLGNGLEHWILKLKNKLLNKEDCNVLSIEWPAGEKWFIITYITAAKRVPEIGNNTSILMQALIKYKGLLLKNVHCIGHSLGAHVCGFAGKPFKGKVGRISGLDPAGPFFRKANDSKRLAKKDATYVDIIHTNACNNWPFWTHCFGLDEDVGHSNFYPNGGKHQPGCSSKKLNGEIGCDHERAYLFYISSMDYGPDGTYYLARPCHNWTQYVLGNCSCGTSPQFLGWNVNTELSGKFFLETESYEPFAIQDPDCSVNRPWNILIIVSYVFVSVIVFACLFVAVTLIVSAIRRILRDPDAPPPIQEEGVATDTENLVENEEQMDQGVHQ